MVTEYSRVSTIKTVKYEKDKYRLLAVYDQFKKMHCNNNILKLALHCQMIICEILSGQKLYVESFTVCVLFYINLRGIF